MVWRPTSEYRQRMGDVLLFFPEVVREGRPHASLRKMFQVGVPGAWPSRPPALFSVIEEPDQ